MLERRNFARMEKLCYNGETMLERRNYARTEKVCQNGENAEKIKLPVI